MQDSRLEFAFHSLFPIYLSLAKLDIIENYFRTSVSRCEGATGLPKFINLYWQIVIIVYEEIWEGHQLELCSISLIYTIKRITLLSLTNKGIKETASNSTPTTLNLIGTVRKNSCILVKHWAFQPKIYIIYFMCLMFIYFY